MGDKDLALNLVLIVDFVAVMNIVFVTTSNAKCINVALSQKCLKFAKILFK